MKKWFDKMDKGKKRLVGAGVAVALVLLLTLGAWGVHAVTAKPQDTVAKNDTVDAKGTGQRKSETKKDDKKSSDQKSQDKAETGKDGEEKGEDKDVAGSDAKEKEPAEAAGSADAAPQGNGNTAPSSLMSNTSPQGNKNSNQANNATPQGNGNTAPSSLMSNTSPQGNKNSNQANNATPQGNKNTNQTAPAQTQNNQQSSQPQNQQPGQQQNQQQNPAPSASVQGTNPGSSEQPKQEEKSAEQPKQEEKQPVWHDPVYDRKWVVDQAAWNETVSTPVYETRTVWYCSTCNANISANPGGHLDETRHGGYWSTGEGVQVGTNTITVPHEEVGHWEDVLVKEGYWE